MKILCIYYSRSGKTKASMEKVAAALDAHRPCGLYPLLHGRRAQEHPLFGALPHRAAD